ncbi:uri1, prefoldin-like chaperone [Coemansia erecta]|uniref:Uri1, prefoldin-like chaperone n=1 Tax=Coemansia erecta TaxID=147472 RepID=A0A9W7XWP8_9FUNG|nr:uri1, prefoldin-like chaperone [Coemansia erecta]
MSAKPNTSDSALRAAVAQYTEYRDEYHLLQKTLTTLPSETTYSALIPAGPLAFFPGHLIHTNEILVLLGDNYFVERSASQAAQIALRRAQYADQKITQISAQLAGARKTGNRRTGEVLELSEDGVVEIKEEIAAGDEVFGEGEQENMVAVVGVVGERVDAELEAKRLRAVRGEQVVGTRQLGDEERRVLEMMERLVAEGDGDEEEEDEKVDGQSDGGEEEEEGDAFEHEDRANAARDDDEDDFNDGSSDEDESASAGNRVAKEEPVVSSVQETVIEPPVERPPMPRKGILKKSTPICLYPRSRGAKIAKPHGRTVRFSPEPADPSEQEPMPPTDSHTAQQQQQQNQNQQQQQQPMKRAVVERSVDSDYAPTLDSVDEDMHAREIAQAYNRMRFAKKDAWGLDRTDIAERVLENTPGVTLVDRMGSVALEDGSSSTSMQREMEQGVRIELPADPSPYNMLNMPHAPPQVIHQEPLLKPASAPLSAPAEAETSSNPKMSRFKAKRLGLE